MLLEVVAQATQCPAFFEAEPFYLVVSFFGWYTEKVDFVKRSDEGGAVASNAAMKVDWSEVPVGQKAENLTDVFFRGRECGRVHGDGNNDDAVFARLADLETIEQRKELDRDDVVDVLGL